MEDVIQIKKSNILRIGIKDEFGKDTGNYLEFDLEDIELPLRIQECEEQHKKNVKVLNMQLIAIDKKEDHKGKKLLSYNQEETIKAYKEFYSKEMEVLDLFLGKEGCKKLLNGRNPYLEMFDDINEMLEPIMPKLKETAYEIKDRIKKKYSTNEKNVLK